MANKTATLKNQAGDNIYPNIVGDNRNAAIKDSATIKHMLAENKISLDLDEAVKGKIDAALQKPTGLTKTKLVGVGANGQENIEIGDNLTLANGKLAAAGGSGIPVVEGTEVEPTAEEKEAGITKKYSIPAAQTSPFILHSNDIGYILVDIFTEPSVVYGGITSIDPKNWALIGGDDTTVYISAYQPISFYSTDLSGYFPDDETTSVDITFPLIDRFTSAACIVTDMDVSRVFLKDGNSIFGSFQTPIIYCNYDGKYRYWSMDAKEGDTTNTLVTIKCKVVNLDGGGGGSAASVQSIDAYGEGGATTIEKGKISTDLTGVDLKVPFVLNIYEDSTLSGTPTRIVMTNKVGEIYLGNFDFINHYLVQMTKGTDGKYSYSSNIIPNPTKNTLFNKSILVPQDLEDPTPILPCTTADNGKVLSVVNGEAQWANVGGSGSVTITFED